MIKGVHYPQHILVHRREPRGKVLVTPPPFDQSFLRLKYSSATDIGPWGADVDPYLALFVHRLNTLVVGVVAARDFPVGVS